MVIARSGGGFGPPAIAASIPPWVSAVPVGEWGTVPNSNLSTSGVMLSGGDAVVGSWNSAIITTAGFYHGTSFITGPCMLIGQTGHTLSYDEFYGFGSFNSDPPQWRLLRGRTSPVVENAEVDGSGNRVSCHGYDSWCYPGSSRNYLLRVGGSYRYSDSGSDTAVARWRMNVSDPANNQPWEDTSVNAANDTPALNTAYDAANDRVICSPGNANAISVYDVAGNSATYYGGKTRLVDCNYSTAALDDSRGIYCQVGGSASVAFFRTNDLTANDYYNPSTTGTAPTMTNTTYGAVIYDAVADKFVMWLDGGKTLWFLTPPASSPYQGGNAWVWSSDTPGSGSTPTAANGTGTFGRFNLVTVGSARIYVLLNEANQSMYFYRAA